MLVLASQIDHDGAVMASTDTTMRDEASQLVESVTETIRIGKESDVPVVISHHKASGIANHGLVRDTLKLIDEARRSQALGLDVYPYVAASTMHANNRWILDGGDQPEEAQHLTLDPTLAKRSLGWRPRLDARQAVQWTADWYRAVAAGTPARTVTLDQIARYEALL